MAYYENVFITRQDISTTQVEELIETFTKVIEDNHGTILKTENWGLRTLAYRIKKNRKGHYVMFNIDAPGVAIHEMERQMRISEDVIRYLTIKLDEFEEGPSAMMSSHAHAMIVRKTMSMITQTRQKLPQRLMHQILPQKKMK